MMRKLATAALITGAVVVGLMAQTGSYLLAPPAPVVESPTEQAHDLSLSETGPHTVGVRQFSGDDVPVPMTVWYPALDEPAKVPTTYSYGVNMLGPDTSIALAIYNGVARFGLPQDRAGGPYPLVVLSHGFAIAPSSYAWLAEHLASWGFVVVAPHHEESLDPGVLWRSTVERPRDIAAAIAFVEGSPDLIGLVDTERVAIGGHSYGGYTALAMAGARIDPQGFQASCDRAHQVDDPLVFLCNALLPRMGEMARSAGVATDATGMWPSLSDVSVDAVISIAGDAAMFGESGLGEITVPVMVLGGTADTDTPFEWGTRLTYDHISSPRKVEVALEGAGHMVFAGECDSVRRILRLVPMGFCSDPGWDRGQVHDLVKSHATAFLLAELHGDAQIAVGLAAPVSGFTGLAHRSEGY